MRRALVLLCSVAVVAPGLTAGGTLAGTHTTGAKAAAAACAKRKQPQPRAPQARKAPTARLDVHKIWLLTFRTSCGTFRVQLLPRTSPRATASLVSLARSRYFDGTIFHRVVPGFVIQGGDPTQSGSGSPGYITVDTPKAGTRYVTGVVAMAKTTAEPRGASGSQFFVMTADAPSLPPDYAVVGRVVGGLPVVKLIGTFGDPADPVGTPTRVVVIDRITVTSR